MAKRELVTLANLKKGAVEEAFGTGLDKVLENIMDLNTEAEKPREFHLLLKLVPTKDRRQAKMVINSKLKLQAPEAMETTIYFGRQGGAIVAEEYDPDQMTFDDIDDDHQEPEPKAAEKNASKLN